MCRCVWSVVCVCMGMVYMCERCVCVDCMVYVVGVYGLCGVCVWSVVYEWSVCMGV